ncbi:MAG: flagellar protein export ATPase FliI [Alphaproteobacteria bacterium]|nr:flagellar protein export ATPase FliI [Alphaproteobacteria bacterium]
MKPGIINNLINEIERQPELEVYGKVNAVQGMLVEVRGVYSPISVGDRCIINGRDNHEVMAEIVGFKSDGALLMPFDSLDGIGPGCKVIILNSVPVIYPDISWLGRVIDPMGNPVDDKGPLVNGSTPYAIRGKPPAAHSRNRVAGKVDLGVRAMNAFLTMCKGQRLGIFAGSGVGKSTIMSMMAQNTNLDITVMGLVGERGREAKEFIEDDFGEAGLARSVIVMATSDQSPLMRRQAAYTTLAVSEYFRDIGKDVLCMMDSVTRFAMAQREISLSAGEPPANKGYTPTVFAELPRLLERAGPGVGAEQGSITGVFTVLVEGDDHNEPISDAVRGILDGHVVLDRSIADRGRFPAINILRSISRVMPGCNTDEENAIINQARKYIASYEDMAELIRLGAYKQGSNPEVDEAIKYYPLIEEFLTQRKGEKTTLEECYMLLAEILNSGNTQAPQQPSPAGLQRPMQ